MAGGRPKGSKQRKISIAGLEGLKPEVLRVIVKYLKEDDKVVALNLLKYIFPVAENASSRDEEEYRGLAKRFADEVVQPSGAGKIPSDNTEVPE